MSRRTPKQHKKQTEREEESEPIPFSDESSDSVAKKRLAFFVLAFQSMQNTASRFETVETFFHQTSLALAAIHTYLSSLS
jgi:hypothetical protein